MKILLYTLALFAAAVLFWFCKHPTKFTADALPDRQIRWGKGGGFVGKETTYTLLENGQIFLRDMGGPLSALDSVKRRKAKALYDTAQHLGLSRLDFKHPGNTYQFIEVMQDNQLQRISWGDAQHPVDPAIATLFSDLEALVKKEK